MLSTSLYSEMKQNPRIGWIQATVDPYAINQEIIELTRENRELRKRLENIETRKPKLIFNLENDDNFKFNLVSSKKLLREELSYEHIPNGAHDVVSIEDVEEYNKALPSQEDYDDYNEKCSRYINMTENKQKVYIRIENNGNISANQVTVKLQFPPEILVFDDYDVEKVEAPRALKIPKNPMNKYYYMNEKKQTEVVVAQPSFQLNIPIISDATRRMIAGHRNNYYTVDEDCLCCEIDCLLHTNVRCSNDFYIVATKKGIYEIESSIICEEYSEPINKTFVVTII